MKRQLAELEAANQEVDGDDDDDEDDEEDGSEEEEKAEEDSKEWQQCSTYSGSPDIVTFLWGYNMCINLMMSQYSGYPISFLPLIDTVTITTNNCAHTHARMHI